MTQDMADKGVRSLDACEGLRWALEEADIPAGIEVLAGTIDRGEVRSILSPARCDELGPQMGEDGFAIVSRNGGWVVTGPQRRSVMYGLLELGRCLRAGVSAAGVRKASFDLRFYKFEMGFPNVPAGWVCTACEIWGRGLWFEHSESFWVRLVQEMSRRHLNALVMWTISPFENWIWNERFPENRVLSREEVDRNRGCLSAILRAAREYGIDVHFQYYVGHCGHRFVHEYGAPAGTDSAVVREYTRYVIESLFGTYGDLAGIWLNSEKMKNSADFVRTCVIEPLNELPRRRTIVQRLWGIRDPEGMRRMIDEHRGRTILAHKTTWDWEFQPIPDARFDRWQELVPGAELLAMWGPCHTTGAASMIGFWADPQFIQVLLGRLEAMGVRHISFNTVGELLGAPGPDPSFTADETRFGRCNRLHVDAVARYAWRTEERFDPAEWEAHLTRQWSLRGRESAPALLDLYRQTSNIHNLYGRFLGHPHVESWWDWPWRHPIQAVPVMTLTMHGDLNRPGELPLAFPSLPPVSSWGGDHHLSAYECIEGRRDGHHLQECIDGMIASADAAERDLSRIEEAEGRKFDPHFVRMMRCVCGIGRLNARLIEGCLSIYSLYTADSMEQVTDALERGLASFRDGLVESRTFVAPRWFPRTYHYRVLTPGVFATEIREWTRLLRRIRQYPQSGESFLHFLRSCRHVVRARQWIKPRHVLPEASFITARAELESAGHALRQARSRAPAGSKVARNLDALRARTETDIDRLGIRSIRCPRTTDETIDRALNHRFELRPDDALRAGGPVQWEFLEFFAGPSAAADRVTFAVCRDDQALIIDVEGHCTTDRDFDTEWQVTPNTFMGTFLLQFSFDIDHDHTHGLGLMLQADGSPPLCVRTTIVPDRGNLHVVDESRQGWETKLQVIGPRDWRARARLPFSALGRTPEDGEIWGFNLACRPRPKRAIEYYFNATFESWGEGNVPRFGHLVFGDQ